jgi:hypothetical protein
MRQAQRDIKEHGSLVRGRFKQLKQNPAILTERDSRQALVKSIKALGLDLEPVNAAPGRPAGYSPLKFKGAV